MELHELLNIYLLALESRHPTCVVEVNETLLGHPGSWGEACVPTEMREVLRLRVASATTLLLVIHNMGVGSVDTSHNGLWKVNIDGIGLTRLTREAADEATGFPFTRTPWSVVSRDGESYAVQERHHRHSGLDHDVRVQS
jgi:hypothetical protein